MTTQEKTPLCGRGLNTDYNKESAPRLPDEVKPEQSCKVPFVSGIGQYHTNEPDKEKRKPYLSVTLAEIRAMVDEPPSVPKARGQWFIPSTLPRRNAAEQEQHGEYWMLWADLDSNPQPINSVGTIVHELLVMYDFEAYTSRSAKEDYQKGRILIPLAHPLCGADWLICQQLLNNKLEAVGITPDRTNERAAQLCYLPNRGEFYAKQCARLGDLFDPLVSWSAEIELIREQGQQRGNTPAKKRQLSDTNDPLVSYLDEHGWILDVNRDGRVDVRCPWENLHTSDSGDSATSYFPAGVGGYGQGHFHCMHSHCDHRTDQDFKEAIGWTTHGMDEIEPPAEYKPLPAFSRVKGGRDDGRIETTRNNLSLAVSRPDICGHALRFDTFLDSMMIGVDGRWREFQDEDYYAIAMYLEQGTNGFKHIPADMLREAVKYTCKNQQFDTAQDWLNGLVWDGVKRVDSFLVRYVGAVDTPYTAAASRYFWSALAGRIITPGVKADMALIAVGSQGAKKTSLVHALVPDDRFAGELDLSDERVEIARSMRGKLVMELGELSGFSKKSVEHLKAFISRQKEEWTPKFKEFTTTMHRRCMFFGTTNSDEILVDETGNRRWLPFRSTGANPVGLAAVRDQLWAEGAALYRQHGVMWQDAEHLAREVHAEFTVTDTWDDRVHEWLYTPEEPMGDGPKGPIPAYSRFTNSDVLEGAVNIPTSKQTKALEARIGKILSRFGFDRVQERIPKAERDKTTGSSRTHRTFYRQREK